MTFSTPSPHAHHLFMPGTTWTQGRNALLARAQAAGGHDYYVFLDDDALLMVRLNDTAVTASAGPTTQASSPWDVFEAGLDEWRPAVGYIHAPWQTVDETQAVTVGTANVDAIVNAFHASTVGVLLPYDATFDDESWFYSQLINSFLVGAFYPTLRVGFNNLGFDYANNKHRYGNEKRQMDWTVGKLYLRSLVREGTDSFFGLARSMCFLDYTNDLCDWKACPRKGAASYALDCDWVASTVNASHPLAASISKACVKGGMVPPVPVFYDKC